MYLCSSLTMRVWMHGVVCVHRCTCAFCCDYKCSDLAAFVDAMHYLLVLMLYISCVYECIEFAACMGEVHLRVLMHCIGCMYRCNSSSVGMFALNY